MPQPAKTSMNYDPEIYQIFSDVRADSISPEEGAVNLSKFILSLGKIGAFERSYNGILEIAREDPNSHVPLVSLLKCQSELPPVMDSNDKQMKVYHMRVWNDLPCLGWSLNGQWNGLVIPETPGSERTQKIVEWLNVNHFTTLLSKSGIPVYSGPTVFALWQIRAACEYPETDNRGTPSTLEYEIPAALIWLRILGSEIYSWDGGLQDSHDPHGVVTSRPGAGGPLWEGSRGFSKERWAFWKSRFGVLETWDQLPDKTRNDAKMARTIMERTETLV